MLWIGLDDTDVEGSRGTGHHARELAGWLAGRFTVLGVTRHQLLRDPRVPMTARNSAAAIHLQVNGAGLADPWPLAEELAQRIRSVAPVGSDPGLCVAPHVPPGVLAFGRRAKTELVTQSEARTIAAQAGVVLCGLGGTEDGVIGALAAVGLAASQDDGRYVLVGRSRELTGLQPVSALLAAGIAAVQTADGEAVTDGLVQADRLRPARRGSRPVAVVEWAGDRWLPLKLD